MQHIGIRCRVFRRQLRVFFDPAVQHGDGASPALLQERRQMFRKQLQQIRLAGLAAALSFLAQTLCQVGGARPGEGSWGNLRQHESQVRKSVEKQLAGGLEVTKREGVQGLVDWLCSQQNNSPHASWQPFANFPCFQILFGNEERSARPATGSTTSVTPISRASSFAYYLRITS